MIDINTAYRQVIAELESSFGRPEAQSLARIIVGKVTGFKPFEILINTSSALAPLKVQKLKAMVARLKLLEPVQYILGETEFFGLTLKVTPSVLIPRPETEELVHWILSECPKARNILEIGTGSGCIAVALAKNIRGARVTATDISEAALSVAEHNALIHGVSVQFIEHNILMDDTELIHGRPFDVIVSNPPYVRESERLSMQANVLDFEPAQALFVPDHNPLLFYRRIGEVARELQADQGNLFLEINEHLGLDTIELLQSTGFQKVQIRKDLNGKDRMVLASLK